MDEKDLLTVYLDNTVCCLENFELFSILKTLKKQYEFLSFVFVGSPCSIDNDFDASIIGELNYKNINKTHVLFSQNDTTLYSWERAGGKSIKYNLERHNKYGGIVINDKSTIDNIKRYLNLY